MKRGDNVRRLQDAVEAYLTGLRLIRGTGGGTSETSYYAPLERLLNTIGGNLKPNRRVNYEMQFAMEVH